MWSFSEQAKIMKTVSASEFKIRCLALLEDVRRTRRPLLVTRHGKPVAAISPYKPANRDNNPLKDSILFQADLVAPVTAAWDATR
jgi:prevent-host-death family protein